MNVLGATYLFEWAVRRGRRCCRRVILPPVGLGRDVESALSLLDGSLLYPVRVPSHVQVVA